MRTADRAGHRSPVEQGERGARELDDARVVDTALERIVHPLERLALLGVEPDLRAVDHEAQGIGVVGGEISATLTTLAVGWGDGEHAERRKKPFDHRDWVMIR